MSAESFPALSSPRYQDMFLYSFRVSSFHSRTLLQATLALSLVVSSLKSVYCDFSIFSAVVPRSPALCLTWYGISSYTHYLLWSATRDTGTYTLLLLQRSLGSKDRVETNGRTDGQTDSIECFTFPANVVGKMCSLRIVCFEFTLHCTYTDTKGEIDIEMYLDRQVPICCV